YHGDQPILWWWIAPRLMLKPDAVHVSKSMRTLWRNHQYRISLNEQFTAVMIACRNIPRLGQDGTWITDDMIQAYTALHLAGYAHSVEVWEGNQLIGGLYGVVLGKIFTGESMFALKPNASKLAFIYLARVLEEKGFDWIDCQQDTPHMRSLGAHLVEADDFLKILRANQLFILEKGLTGSGKMFDQ
ncbi:MAG TPA: leucyl/phenylalanyl-tRNA--protein transferase, partial [Saprospiraceae bacterium]|nr:leucyl/phenylalanyl-tRNA--protein transferase [Saprospiraceae bacterium]